MLRYTDFKLPSGACPAGTALAESAGPGRITEASGWTRRSTTCVSCSPLREHPDRACRGADVEGSPSAPSHELRCTLSQPSLESREMID